MELNRKNKICHTVKKGIFYAQTIILQTKEADFLAATTKSQRNV